MPLFSNVSAGKKVMTIEMQNAAFSKLITKQINKSEIIIKVKIIKLTGSLPSTFEGIYSKVGGIDLKGSRWDNLFFSFQNL